MVDYEYRQYIKLVQKNIIDDPSKFWEYVKDKKRDRRQLNTYTYEDTEVKGQAAADAFATYFASVFHNDVPILDYVQAAQAAHDCRDATTISIMTVDETVLKKAVRRLKSRS